jgi:nitrite reductase (cytochrome c-552)
MKARTGGAIAPVLITVVFLLLGVGIGILLTNIQKRQDEGMMSPSLVVEIPEGELDASVWGRNFPREYGRFMKMEEDYGRTLFGGSTPFSKIEEKPFLKAAWAGYAFSIDYNEERGHAYALTDQKETKRTTERSQPGACANCHAGEAPRLIQELGWERFNSMPYDSLRDMMHTGGTCNDCHDPETMNLRISRPAFVNAMEARGVDLSRATRQEMRTYVCGQCHVEYYFAGPNKLLTFPWAKGLVIDSIEAYYEEIQFSDWTHSNTGNGMLKMQHPEFETFSTSLHYKSGVACADCHMPYMRVGGVKVSDHWIRSPVTNVSNACQTCHRIPEADLVERVETIQKKTREMVALVEAALTDAMDAIVAAREVGISDSALADAQRLHRSAQMRWDFVDAENSMGFHSPQEAARILSHAVDLARQAQLAAREAVLQDR